jgi:hypothetical protein
MARAGVVVCLLFHFFRFFSHRSTINRGHVSKGLYSWEVGNGQELQGWPIHPPAFSPNASPCSVEHLQNQGNMVRGLNLPSEFMKMLASMAD